MATRRNGLPAFKDPEPASDDEEEDVESQGSDDSQSDNPVTLTPRRKTGKPSNIGSSRGIIVQTGFDAYFAHNKSGRGQTSSNVFSELVPPLSAEEYREAIGTSGGGGKGQVIQASISQDAAYRGALFARFICELNEGFNILCYGFGSKRRVLNQFAAKCSTLGHVVVVNGFQPDLGLKDVLNSIEDIPPIQVLNLSPTSIEKQVQRINEFFAPSSSDVDLYLIVHNIDAAPLRTAKAKSVLSILAHNLHIHLIASIDHINAPLLWSSSENFSRKPEEEVQADNGDDIPCRGFAWLWHDLTTLESYDFELAFADRSSVSGGHAGGARRKTDAIMASQSTTAMSETAASHILASVTQKAQKLFALLGNKQLETITEGAGGEGNNAQQSGLAYDVLFSAARDNFIATNDTALRTLLGEFRDHNLIVSSQAGVGGGEVLWIPMRKERLANVLQTLASS